MCMKNRFRKIGICSLIVGLFCRFNPQIVLPRSFSWSGDFFSSRYGMRVSAFSDLMNIVILCSLILIILSFTTIIEASRKSDVEGELDDEKERSGWDEFVKEKKLKDK